jgi:hypothetical protein
VISDERVTSTDDPRSDVAFDLVFDVAPANLRHPTTVDERPCVDGRRCIRRGRGKEVQVPHLASGAAPAAA